MWKTAPLKSSFMMASVLGFLIVLIYGMSGRISSDWSFALGFLFVIMFIASMVSMRNAPIDSQLEYAKGFVHAASEDSWKPKPKKAPAKKAKKTRAKVTRKRVTKKKPKKAPKKKAPKKKTAKKAKKKATKKRPAKKAKRKPARKATKKK